LPPVTTGSSDGTKVDPAADGKTKVKGMGGRRLPTLESVFLRQRTSSSTGVGVLWKITVPRSRARVSCEALRPVNRCRAHHHAPTAEPRTPAINPKVRLLKVCASCPRKTQAECHQPSRALPRMPGAFVT
jgi:hypothetical protein